MRNIELPNGHIIEGVPEGVSKEEIRDKAIAKGLATPEDFGMTPEPPVSQKPSSVMESMFGDYLPKQQMSTGGLVGNDDFVSQGDETPVNTRSFADFAVENAPEIGGAIGGTLGAAGGIPGAMALGSIGAGLGSLIQQTQQSPDKPVSYVEAGKEAALSGAIEGVGGVAFKALGAVAPSVKTVFLDSFERAMAKMGRATSESATEFAAKRGVDIDVPVGAPLTKGIEEASEEVGRGVDLAIDELSRITNNAGREAASNNFKNIVDTGNEALQKIYAKGLKDAGLEKYKVDTVVIKRRVMDEVKKKMQQGVRKKTPFASPEGEAFIVKFNKEAGDKVNADLFESEFISEAKAIQRKAKMEGNSSAVNDMKNIISLMEGAMEQSIALQGGRSSMEALKSLRKTYAEEITNLNLRAFKKMSEDPKRIYSFIQDSKTAREFSNAMRTAQKLGKIDKSAVDKATRDGASILVERKLQGLNVGNARSANELRAISKKLRGLESDKEFMATLKNMGGESVAADVKALSKFTGAMVDRLYKNKGFDKQLITDAALSATVGGAYATVRLMMGSVAFASKRLDKIGSIRRWQNRLASGEIGLDASVKLAKQLVGQDFVDFLQERGEVNENGQTD